jgi:DNA recombination protein RmuC
MWVEVIGICVLAIGLGLFLSRLNEKNQRLQADFRDTITNKLDEKLEKSFSLTRLEMQSGLLQSTHALESKLYAIGQNVESKLNENLKEGFKHFEKVQEHLKGAELKLASLNTVGQSISDLNSLLKLPHLRGGFGEATLERLLADFLPAHSFELQYAIVPHSPERVDAVVKLAKQILPIDSKFPREQVLPLFESNDPKLLEQARRMLSDFIKTQAKSISEKYIRPDHGTTDMALLFLPSETLYFEVIRDGKLFEHLTKYKVFPVSPNTLCISLHSVLMAQEYYEMAKGVDKTIEDLKKAQRHFELFDKKFEDLGQGLRKAQEAFEIAKTHMVRYENSIVRLDSTTEAPTTLASQHLGPPSS